MGCALITSFQVRSLYVPTKDRSPLWGHFWESLVFRLHSKIGQIHLSIEAQCDHHILIILKSLIPITPLIPILVTFLLIPLDSFDFPDAPNILIPDTVQKVAGQNFCQTFRPSEESTCFMPSKYFVCMVRSWIIWQGTNHSRNVCTVDKG